MREKTLLGGAAIDSLGSGLFMASAPVYFLSLRHFEPTTVALVLTVAAACGLLTPMPVGRLADRVGPVRTYFFLALVRAGGYAAYALVEDVWQYATLTCLLVAADRASSPLFQIIVAGVTDESRRVRVLSRVRAVRNVGLTGGILLAGLVIVTESAAVYRAAYLMDGLTYVLLAGAVYRATRGAVPTRPAPASDGPVHERPRGSSPLRNRDYMIFTFCSGVFTLYDTLAITLLPIWLITSTDLPKTSLPVLLAVNTVLTVVLQLLLPAMLEKRTARGTAMRVAAALLVTACALFAASETVGLYSAVALALGAVVVLTIGENLHAILAWEWSYTMADPRSQSHYLGAFSLGVSLQQLVGPLLLVAVFMPLQTAGWALLGLLFLVSAEGLIWAVGRLRSESECAQDSSGSPELVLVVEGETRASA
ncbi:MFS transporter [Nocardioides piscis]|uniref:MFS transporter n=1 Tax=Nocardioides piscis TaxID=2714938 RepID=A0A6G7YJ84_9ACTN|nr:MFS transporter [Nocardioides piscis]QIK76796.1 MFS transporter [Nocardioides piscis]